MCAVANDGPREPRLDVRRRLRVSALAGVAAGAGVVAGGAALRTGLMVALVGAPLMYLTVPWFARRGATKVHLPPSDLIARERGGGRTSFREGVGFFLMLCVRGLALWIVWPVAFVVWVVRIPVGVARHRHLRLRQVAGWFDTNLIALLESSLLRPFFPTPTRFVPWARVAEIARGPSMHDLW